MFHSLPQVALTCGEQSLQNMGPRGRFTFALQLKTCTELSFLAQPWKIEFFFFSFTFCLLKLPVCVYGTDACEGLSGAAVTGSCRPLDMDTGNQNWVLC